MSGMLIAVCGLDGSGKTTQLNLLKDWFERNNKPYIVTKQPTDFYRQDTRVREYLDNGICTDMRVLALLSAADRRHHLSTVIEPAIKNGISVISDRYLYSALSYFSFRGLEEEYIRNINGEIRKPDITVFLDLEPKITLQRVALRDGDLKKYEELNIDNFVKIREAFHRVLPSDALRIDATLPYEKVHQIIINEVTKLI